MFSVCDLQHLQAAAPLEIAGPPGTVARPEAVETGVRTVVLGQVDLPSAGVDRGRLVGHEARVLDRHRAGGAALRRRHLEDEPVVAGTHLRPAQATSSHVSHEPHGVGPPAQLTIVPPSVACDPVNLPPANVTAVVPPPSLR